MEGKQTHLHHQSPQTDEKAHQVARVVRHNVREISTDVFSCGAHCGVNRLSSNIHEEFCEPFEHHLDLLWIGLDQVGGRKRDSDIVDTSCDFFIGLYTVLEVILKMQGHIVEE